MEDLKIVYLPIKALTPYERNAKEHPPEQVAQIQRSIADYGMNDPIGVWGDKNIVVEGHGRLLACKALGMKEVPCIRLDYMTDEQRREYAIVHNSTNMFSGFDPQMLGLEIGDLPDFDAEFFGFSVEREDPPAEDDDFDPVVPEEPKAHIGDIYQLGRHRLMCGDSTLLADVEALMGGEKADMLLTDPPYNVDYQGTAGKIKNDSMDRDDFQEFLASAFDNANRHMKAGAAFHIWYGYWFVKEFLMACASVGLVVHQHLIWVKNGPTLSRSDFQLCYENVISGETMPDDDDGGGFGECLYGWSGGAAHRWFKQRKEKDVMYFPKPLHSKEHPTMKPIPLFDYEMKCNTKPGDNVLDLFGGSGTTLMAAEQNGRNAFVMEYDEKFVDVIVDRWERFTGQKAVLLNGTDGKQEGV